MFASIWVRLALEFIMPALLPLPQNNAACIERQDAQKAYGVDYPRPDNAVRGLHAPIYGKTHHVHDTVRIRPLMSCQGCSMCAFHIGTLLQCGLLANPGPMEMQCLDRS